MAEILKATKNLLRCTSKAVGYSWVNLAKHPLRWGLFALLMLVPLVNYIIFGILLKIEWGKTPDFKRPLETWFNGFRAMIIILIYELIPILLLLGCFVEDIYEEVNNTNVTSIIDTINSLPAATIGINAFDVLTVVLPLLSLMLAIPAEICFARKGFVAALDMDENLNLIRKTGLGKFVCAFLFQVGIGAVLTALYSCVLHIPQVGFFLAIAVIILLVPHFIIIEGKFWSLFFEKAAEEEMPVA